MSYTTIENTNNFSVHENTVFINSITNSCNITAVNNKATVTHNTMKTVRPGSDCALYCAHKDCGSALNFYKNNEETMQRKCKSISYLKFGARKLLLDDRFSFKNKELCNTSVNK